MNLFDLSGKKAIVTGGSRGLGKGMAMGLLEAGAEVVIIGKSEKVFETAKEFCDAGYLCHGVQGDAATPEGRAELFAAAAKKLENDLDILINAAGITLRHESIDYPRDKWLELMEVNMTAPFELSQMAARIFIPKGWGKIVNVGSMLSFFGATTAPGYAASKGAVAQITKSHCVEWASKGITVNCIAPGFFLTDMNAAICDPALPRCQEINLRIPAQRWGKIEDIRGLAVFLSSHASDYVNGAVIPIDGGLLIKGA